MHTANINKFMGMVLDELQKAESKHPKFCDEATTHYASDLFYEEYFEALNAYQQGDKEHALKEFAQCGAVIMRIMETIEKEMK